MSPLREGGDFLAAGKDSGILLCQSRLAFERTRLANLHDHQIVTPLVAGIGLFGLSLTSTTESLAIELQHLLATDRAIRTIGQGRLVRDCDAEKAQPSLTLGIFDDLELGGHCRFPLGGSDERILQKLFYRVNPHFRRTLPIRAEYSH